MKHKRRDSLMECQRRCLRAHPWQLNADGVYTPHRYDHKTLDELSYWDDVGFVHAKRKHIVWWQHPRYVYHAELSSRAWEIAGPGPRGAADFWEGVEPQYEPVGASRKRIVSYRVAKGSRQEQDYFAHVSDVMSRLATEGIEFDVRPSVKLERLNWAMGVSLIAPIEIRCETEAAALVALARPLVKREITLQEVFGAYVYTREDWLREVEQHPRVLRLL